jgi:hypothetical protein
MSTTITALQSPVNAYVTQQTSQIAAATTNASSAAAGTTNPSTDTVALSDTAQEMAAQATSWASMSQSQLQGIYNSTWNTFVQFDEQFASQGSKVAYDDVQTTGTPAELAFSKKIADYMVSIHSEPPGNVPNPYAGASRAMVTSIMYDTSGKYTTSEREAAAAEQGAQDYTYLSALGNAAVRSPAAQRNLYQGLLDYYDAQSPVEKSVIPSGYQEQVEGYLQQQETLLGTSSTQDTDSVLQAMLTAFNENTASESASTLTTNEPIWSQLVNITSSAQ